MTKLTVAFRISAKASKNACALECEVAIPKCKECVWKVRLQLYSLVALWSLLILISKPDTFELGLSSRLRKYLPTVEISSCAMELATLCTLLASQDLPRSGKQRCFIGYVCYHFKVFILWQTFPCCHTNYLIDMNLDIQIYRYMAFGPNPDHIKQLKNRKPNENT